jgi:hypothetical protein
MLAALVNLLPRQSHSTDGLVPHSATMMNIKIYLVGAWPWYEPYLCAFL